MTLEQVACDISRDDRFAAFHKLDVTIAFLRGDFVTDVQKLAQVRVEFRTALIVSQRGCEFLSGPI